MILREWFIPKKNKQASTLVKIKVSTCMPGHTWAQISQCRNNFFSIKWNQDKDLETLQDMR